MQPADTMVDGAPDGLRDRKRAASRHTTVEAAYRLFLEHGYDEVTVADICAASGIARRTFFRYFASKEDVVMEPVRDMADVVDRAIVTASPDWSDSQVLRQSLTQLADDSVDRRTRLVAMARVLRATRSSGVSPSRLLSDHETRIAALLAQRSGNAEPDLQTRLLVARTLASFRVWLDDLLSGAAGPHPAAHLDAILNSA